VLTKKETTEAHGRILALDFGTRRIGLAVSDALGITAQGLPTLLRKNKRTDLAALRAVLEQYEVREIVVGLPLRLSGAESSSSEKARDFAQLIAKEFELPVHMWDERFTSVEANRVLRDSEMSIKKRGEAVDRLSAVLILQAFLERRSL
jgi:putative Holliday junction resolvase